MQKFLFNMLLLRLAGLEERKQGMICFPPDLKWEVLKKLQKDDLRERIYYAMSMLNKADTKYRGLMDPESVFGEFDDGEIYFIIERMDKLTLGSTGEDYFRFRIEIVLQHYEPDTIKQIKMHHTPQQVSDLLVKLLDPEEGTVYDPCCSTGIMLLCAAFYMEKRGRSFQLYGQEGNETIWRTTRRYLVLAGLDADLGDGPADIARQDLHADLKADYVLGNPPYHGYIWKQEQPDDRRFQYGIPSGNGGEFAWMQHMLYHLKEEGRMGAVFSNGILASRRAQDRKIRAALLREDILEAIITLPPGIFYNTKVSASLWILCKRKSAVCKGRILLVDARKVGEKAEGKLTVLPDSVQKKIIRAYRDYRNGTADDQTGFCRQISVEEVDTENCSLAPARYVISERQEVPGMDELEIRGRRLETRLMELMDENRETLEWISSGQQENTNDRDGKYAQKVISDSR